MLGQAYGPEALGDLVPLQLAGGAQIVGLDEGGSLLQQCRVVFGGLAQGLVGAFQAVFLRFPCVGLFGAADAGQSVLGWGYALPALVPLKEDGAGGRAGDDALAVALCGETVFVGQLIIAEAVDQIVGAAEEELFGLARLELLQPGLQRRRGAPGVG